MKKILAFSFLLTTTLSSNLINAEALKSMDKSDFDKSSYEEIKGLARSYASEMSEVEGIDEYRAMEKGYLNLIFKFYPGFKDYWGDVYTYGDSKIVQADSLIDLRRIKLDKFHIGASLEKNSAQYSVRESDGAVYPDLKNSRMRMLSGLAPIGPDNESLILCRLHNDPRASYFEISKHDSWRLLNAIGSGMTIDQACMSESMTPLYWKKRIDSLIDKRGNIVRSKRQYYEH